MEIFSLSPLLVLTVVVLGLGMLDSHKLLCVVSLSLDDSFLSSSKQRLQKDHEQGIPGIWKLTTNALPYELDIRSKLDRSFSNDNKNNNNIDNDNDDFADSILLKLNQDGTFKQCDEGYREGRWMTGRWKLQLQTEKEQKASSETTNPKILSWLLILAMNRQYFGPPFDVLLEAHTNSTSSACGGKEIDTSDTKEGADDESMSTTEMPLKSWQGVVRKGKFLRPSPGKHPLDREYIDCISAVLEDAVSLGNFSLEQALSTNAIDRTASKQTTESDETESTTRSGTSTSSTSDIVSKEDDTFFFPCSSSSDDAGFLQ